MTLTGNETLEILGQSAAGIPASAPFITTTQEIADLAGAGTSVFFNVTAYGATGNGVTNDAVSIQAAIDAAGAADGGIVYFPNGSYLVNTTLLMPLDSVSLRGESWVSSYIFTNSTTTTILKVGNLDNTDVNKPDGIALIDMGFEVPSASSVTNVQVYGATLFKAERCDFHRGAITFDLRNADMTELSCNRFRATAANAVAIRMTEGLVDDVTTLNWIGGIVDVTGIGGKGLVFADGSGGTPNEFNNLFICAVKFDGNSTASTIGVQFVTGGRNIRFQNCEFKQWTTSSIDGATALLSGQNMYYSVDNCKFVGVSNTVPVQHIYAAEGTSGKTIISLRNTQLHTAGTGVMFSNTGTKSPKVFLDSLESSTMTNWLEADDNTVTPNIAVAQVNLGGSVTNKVGATLATATVSWEDHGTRAGNFLLYAQGTAIVADGQTTSAVPISPALQYTPSAKDITVIKTNSAIAGQFWVTSISAAGFTLNVQTAPSATTHVYQYKVRAS